MHNLCLEMLQLGFHMAFRELFKLVEEEKKAALSEDSFRKTDDTPIEEHQDKLSYLKEMLISAEISKRQGCFCFCDCVLWDYKFLVCSVTKLNDFMFY